MLKWIVFDAMGVVYTVGDDTKELLIPFVRSMGSDSSDEDIASSYDKAMVGDMSGGDFWMEVALSSRYPECEERYLSESFSVAEDFPEAVKAVSVKYKVGMISNDIDEWSRSIRIATGVDCFFDCVVTSSSALARKPEKGIYLKFAELAGVDPSECLFIDDKESNVRGAVAAGMKGVLLDRKCAVSGSDGITVIRSLRELEAMLQGLN